MKRSRQDDENELTVVEAVVEAIDNLPENAANLPRTELEIERSAFAQKVRQKETVLERLILRHLPDARLPSPCGQCRRPWTLRTPISNLVECLDLCQLCIEEARRSALAVISVLRDGSYKGPFLPEPALQLRLQKARAMSAQEEPAKLKYDVHRTKHGIGFRLPGRTSSKGTFSDDAVTQGGVGGGPLREGVQVEFQDSPPKVTLRAEIMGKEIVQTIAGPTRAHLARMVIGQPGQTHTWDDILIRGMQGGFWITTKVETLRRQGTNIQVDLGPSLKGYWHQDSKGVRWDPPM